MSLKVWSLYSEVKVGVEQNNEDGRNTEECLATCLCIYLKVMYVVLLANTTSRALICMSRIELNTTPTSQMDESKERLMPEMERISIVLKLNNSTGSSYWNTFSANNQ